MITARKTRRVGVERAAGADPTDGDAPSMGPSKAAPFHKIEFSATALGNSARGISDGNNAWRAGPSQELTAALKNVIV